MSVLIFLVLVALRVWSWAPAAYPFLAFLILVGVMVTNNFLLMLVFWHGVAWAGCLIFVPYWQRAQGADCLPGHPNALSITEGSQTQPGMIKTPFYRALLWQANADIILLVLLFLINIRPTTSVALSIYPFPDAAWLSTSPAWRGIVFGLGAAALLIKAAAWAFIPRGGLSFTPLGSDQTYCNSFSLSLGLVAAYQTVRLGHVCLPSTSNFVGTVGIITTLMVLAHLLYRGQASHLVWHPLTTLTHLGQTALRWDQQINLGVIDLSVSALDTLGATCMEFEIYLIQIGQTLMKGITAAQTGFKRLYRLVLRK